MLSSRLRIALVVATATATAGVMIPVQAVAGPPTADDTPVLLTPKGEHEDGSDESTWDKLRDAYYWSRLLSGDTPLTLTQAATLRTKAGKQAATLATAA